MSEVFVDVDIPIRGYLKKFISVSKDTEPFIVQLSKCHFSAIIYEPLKKPYVKVGISEFKNLDARLKVRMNSTVMRESKFWFDVETIMCIDSRLKAMFDQQLIDFITIMQKKKGDIKESIFAFMEYYNLSDDDIKWDTLVKMYYRARYHVPEQKQAKMEKVIAHQLALQL